jgi:hypothetical protein
MISLRALLSFNRFSQPVLFVAALFALGLTNALCEESTNAIAAPKAAGTNPVVQMTVELRDGSRVIGQCLDDPLSFHSASIGDLKLPVNGIASVEFPTEGSNSLAKLTATNGDTLTLQFLPKTLRLETCFGKATLAAKLLSNFKVSVTTPGDSGALTNGLLSFWNFDGTSPSYYPPDGGKLMLPLQTGNDGRGPVNPGTVVPGKIQNAINFGGMGYPEGYSRPYNGYGSNGRYGPNGLNQGLFIPAGQFPIRTTFTITAWVKQNEGSSQGERSLIACSWDGNGGRDYILQVGDGRLQASVGTQGYNESRQPMLAEQHVNFSDSLWHFCVFQCQDGQYIRVKVDSNDWTTVPLSGSLAGASPRPFQVGANIAQGIFNSNCKIDMLGVWDRVLTHSELAGLYNNGNGMEYPFTTRAP